MTEKRFIVLEDTNGGLDTVLKTMVKDNGKFLTHRECCDLLNELNDENEQLKKELKALRKKYNDFSDAVDKRLKELQQ